MKTITTIAMLALAAWSASAPAAAVDFLVPGMALDSISLEAGARVAYLVVTQTFGSADSSYVELAVLSRGRGEIRLEIVTGPYPLAGDETVAVRLRLSEKVVSISSAEEFRACLRELLIREGAEKFREPTREELDELGIEDLFIRPSAEAERRSLAAATVATPAGSFSCSGVETAKRETKTVKLGGVEAERIEEEMTRIWLSKDVPLWGLVKSRVERRNIMQRAGSPSPGAPRVTITESVLLSYRKPRSKS